MSPSSPDAEERGVRLALTVLLTSASLRWRKFITSVSTTSRFFYQASCPVPLPSAPFAGSPHRPITHCAIGCQLSLTRSGGVAGFRDRQSFLALLACTRRLLHNLAFSGPLSTGASQRAQTPKSPITQYTILRICKAANTQVMLLFICQVSLPETTRSATRLNCCEGFSLARATVQAMARSMYRNLTGAFPNS